MASESGCLFCGIVSGDVPGDVVRRTERVVAFRDLNPQAPTHVLVIPVDHHVDAPALAAADPETLAELLEVAADVAGGPFRFVFNTGAEVGQSVFHVHGHVLAGRGFGWPPG
jgi:histidine triad (HIT) family protein